MSFSFGMGSGQIMINSAPPIQVKDGLVRGRFLDCRSQSVLSVSDFSERLLAYRKGYTEDDLRRYLLPYQLTKLKIDSTLSNEIYSQLKRYREFKDVNEVHINGAISNMSMSYLNHLTALETLNLSSREITDEGLFQLRNLSKLRHLNLKDTNITQQGITEFQTKFPKVEIVHDN